MLTRRTRFIQNKKSISSLKWVWFLGFKRAFFGVVLYKRKDKEKALTYINYSRKIYEVD